MAQTAGAGGKAFYVKYDHTVQHIKIAGHCGLESGTHVYSRAKNRRENALSFRPESSPSIMIPSIDTAMQIELFVSLERAEVPNSPLFKIIGKIGDIENFSRFIHCYCTIGNDIVKKSSFIS